VGGPQNGTFTAPSLLNPTNTSRQCLYIFLAGPGQRVDVSFATFNLRGQEWVEIIRKLILKCLFFSVDKKSFHPFSCSDKSFRQRKLHKTLNNFSLNNIYSHSIIKNSFFPIFSFILLYHHTNINLQWCSSRWIARVSLKWQLAFM
jgi:hypothetical protein